MRYALINLSTNIVENVVEIDPNDGSVTPVGYLTFRSDSADINDTWDGTKTTPAQGGR